jgi:restriction-modification enzyme MmeI-like protein
MRIASVFVVIIGFASNDTDNKYIYEYESLTSDPHQIKAKNINPYLIDGPDILIKTRSKPISDVPEMVSGNKPIDDGNYLFTPKEKSAFLSKEPNATPYFKKWLGSVEFINNVERWCLHLTECPPETLKSMPEVLKRVEAVRIFRKASKSAPTKKIGDTPTLFHTTFKSQKTYLALPQVSSERRVYIPVAFLTPEVLCGDKLRLIANADLYHFGIITSLMHMEWMRYVTGRLKSDYQYSAKIVYNNYPWPEPSDKQKQEIEVKAQAVLDARNQFLSSTLADLYDPNTMPPILLKAHQALDNSVDKIYRKSSFKNNMERIEFLFELYQNLTQPLLSKPKRKKRKSD